MPIKFRVIERGQPGVAGGGTKKFYASASTTGVIDIDGLTKNIEKISTVSGADIRAVLYAMVDVSADLLGNGNIVRLGDLGSLRPGLSSRGEESEEKVTARTVKNAKVIFNPGNRIKEMLKTVTFQKIS